MAGTKNSKLSVFSKFLEDNWRIVISLLIILTIGVRFFGITKASIWHDEGFTAMLASRDWLAIWQGSARDVHPPLYYELLHGWSLLFGSSALAIRSFSAVCGVLVVALGYKITLRISKNFSLALLAFLFLALNPFLVRYSQEARMYGVLGVFLLIALYGLIMVVENNKDYRGYLLYIVGISAGLYTHYFTALVVISFWLYVAIVYFRRKKDRINLLVNWRWWAANLLALLIFLPWVPNMIKQLTRAQGLGWLTKTSLQTFHDSIWQYFTFTDAHKIYPIVYWAFPVIVLGLCVYVILKDKAKYKFSWLLLLFSFVPLFMAIAISFIRPIYHERYFVFSIIGICMMIAIAIGDLFKKSKVIALTIFIAILVIQIVGLRNVNSQANHQMGSIINALNNNYVAGDRIVSGELYTYFDGSFYNRSGAPILLYTDYSRPNGFGESGLIYDKNIYLDSYSQLSPGRVWVIGKTGQHKYYETIPSNWVLLKDYVGGYSELRLYQIQ